MVGRSTRVIRFINDARLTHYDHETIPVEEKSLSGCIATLPQIDLSATTSLNTGGTMPLKSLISFEYYWGPGGILKNRDYKFSDQRGWPIFAKI
jgi:hypothetical protein